jgi:hypothetical protein
MKRRIEHLARAISLGACIALSFGSAGAAPKPEPVKLTAEGEKLQARYSEMLTGLHAEITKALPAVSEQKKAALLQAREGLEAAEAEYDTAKKSHEKINKAKALVDHAKGKWLGGAAKGIAAAEAALKKASTEAEREAAKKELAKWQADREAGLKALDERQRVLDKALLEQANANEQSKAAQARLVQAQADERTVVESILADLQPILSSEKLDARLIRAAVLARATPRGLAEFAQQGKEQTALVEQLLSDDGLMKQMLIAGGAEAGKYGPAMQIYVAIQKASPKAREGVFQRLALATSLEHAVPIKQSNAQTSIDAPTIVDPVKRYLHYEKAYLDGELDPAFKYFSVWEYRMVVDCNAPDAILAWGREMLRNYRPDHIYNPDYGWRYSGTVRTEVKYGSECVKDDLPSLHVYQNIPKDGGVCGRRAFFGRYILKCFGIPTWGVTQHAHAAVGHWTPKGWVINLGAGFQHSWWSKDESPRSGSDFLLETQARTRPRDYMKVLRAQWISRVLGEQEYNDRKHVAGGLWSNMAHFQALSIAAVSKAVDLAPLGQELGEANEAEAKKALALEKVTITAADQKPVVGKDGTITMPAVAYSKPAGHFAVMRSFAGGLQVHASGGFMARYVIDAPQAGRYRLAARVATVHEGQKFLFTANDASSPVEAAVPYTVGMWRQSKPVEVVLVKGQNILQVAIKQGSRGVAIKEFTLTPVE